MFPGVYYPKVYYPGAYYPPMGGVSAPVVAMVGLLQNRAGIARANATRANYYTHTEFMIILVDGIDRSTYIQPRSVRLTLALNDEVDTAFFTVKPNQSWTPVAGQHVYLSYGEASHAEFGGQISRVRQRRLDTVAGIIVFHDVECVDWLRLFDRRLVTQAWYSVSVTQIAIEIIDGYTSGFTRNRITGGLPVVDFFPATNARPSELMRRLANLVEGGFVISPHRDVALFPSGGQPLTSNPLPLTNTQSALAFANDATIEQVRTRVIVEGMGSQTRSPIGIGDTIIPIDDASIFSASGGEAVAEQQVLTYTGTQAGGPGSLVGPGVAPDSYPVVTPAAGIGIESGVHGWASTWVTGSGETLPGPVYGATMGPLAAPGSTPGRALASGTELGFGTYLYATTFVVGAGETTPGPTGAIATSAGIQPPPSPGGSISNDTFFTHNGDTYAIGDSVWFRVTYVDGAGGETDGTDTNTITITAGFGGGIAAANIINIPSPSDQNVVAKRVYANVNGSFGRYQQLAPFNYTTVWTSSSSGSFKIGSNPAQERVQLTAIPTGPAGTTARNLYRTTVNGSTLKFLATIAGNFTTSYLDAIPDGSLGADAPSSNTTQMNQAALTNIAVGPTGVTSRKVYRSVANDLTYALKLVTTIADNTTTTYTDSTADGALGAAAPGGDTSGLSQEDGQVNAGSSTLIVAAPGAFSTTGGWALVADQVIRYTGISGQTLTGIPATGVGSLQATVSYGATISEAPRLTGVSGVVRAIPNGTDVRLRVTRNDTTAQAIMAAVEGGDGIHEFPLIDGRLNLDGATERGDADLAAFSRTLLQAEWDTRDLNAKPGRAQTITFTGQAPIEVTLVILAVDEDMRVPGQRPFRHCRAGTVKPAGLLDAVVTEQN